VLIDMPIYYVSKVGRQMSVVVVLSR
jgi:hypothetical protein